MNPAASKGQGRSKASSKHSKGTSKKSKKKKRDASAQNAGQPSGPTTRSAAVAPDRSRKDKKEKKESDEGGGDDKKSPCCSCCRRGDKPRGESGPCSWFLSLFGLEKRKKVDDFAVLDDNASLDRGLLWPDGASHVSLDDYLEFAPEHERSLAEAASNVKMPVPPKDRTDY